MQNDMDLLQGSWNVSELQMEGQTISGGMLSNARVVITGNRFSSVGMGAVYEGVISFNASATPRQLDIKFDAGPEKGNTNLGIYEIDGDTWKLCLSTRGKLRPSTFSAAAGSGFVFETLTRGTAATSVKNDIPAKTAKSAPSNAAQTEFEGEWQMVAGTIDGVPMEESAVKWVKRVTHGNETTVTAGPQIVIKIEFTFDSSKSPKTIDYVNWTCSNKGKSQQGIYEFADGLLKI